MQAAALNADERFMWVYAGSIYIHALHPMQIAQQHHRIRLWWKCGWASNIKTKPSLYATGNIHLLFIMIFVLSWTHDLSLSSLILVPLAVEKMRENVFNCLPNLLCCMLASNFLSIIIRFHFSGTMNLIDTIYTR